MTASLRKRLLVKPALQLRQLAFTLVIVLASSVAVYVVMQSALWLSLGYVPMTETQIGTLQTHLRLSFFFILLILLAACGFEAYLSFHRIAGPLYVLEKHLKLLAEGRFDEPARLREGDELQDLFRTLERTRISLKGRVEKQAKLLDETLHTLERLSRELPDKNRSGAVREEINALKERLSRPS